jgi:hypothetical protein
MSRDIPILFSAPMVRAILAGTKTQTRRVVKPQPPSWARHYWGAQGTYSGVAEPRHYWASHENGEAAFDADDDFEMWPGRDTSDQPSDEDIFGGGGFESPFGSEANCIKSAARLWVREAWRAAAVLDSSPPRDIPSDSRIWHEADDSVSGLRGLVRMGKLRPGMFMPRWASRITLEVTGVRVERLQDISEADALAEGIVPGYGGFGLADGSHFHAADPRQSYLGLWEAINGPGSVEANPWVWAVAFKSAEAA